MSANLCNCSLSLERAKRKPKSLSAVVNTKPLFEKTVSTAQRKRVFGRWGDFPVTPHAIN
jgi:hypothetical protein